MARDTLAAAILLLKADVEVALLVNTRVFGEELPPEEAADMPRAAVLLRTSSNAAGIGGYSRLEVNGIDAYCFGETPAQAEEVRRAVHEAFKQARRAVVEETLLHSFDQIGSPRADRDPDTQWPYSLSSWRMLASERQAT